MGTQISGSVKRWLRLLCLIAFDAVAFSLACYGAFFLRFRSGWAHFWPVVSLRDLDSYWFALLIANYLVLSQIGARHLYSFDRFRTWRDDAGAIIRSTTVTMALLLALSFFYRQVQFSRQMVLIAWPLAILSLTCARLLVRWISQILYRNGQFCRPAAILGEGPMLDVLVERLQSDAGLGFRLVGWIGEKLPSDLYRKSIAHLGSVESVELLLAKNGLRCVFVVEENLDHHQMLGLVEVCERLQVEMYLVPQVHDLLVGTGGLRDLHGLPIMELREEPLQAGTLLIKRAIDLLASGLGLLLTAPLFLGISILVRLDSKGPAFFSQERVGYRGRRFRMWKFRSMIVNAEALRDEVVGEMAEPVFKLKKDPRVTRIGRFLRQSSLDELPQLWNVFVGEMSLVGPRPEEAGLVERYNIWQRRRLKVKPGITGLQQVSCRGTPSLAERVRYDIYYIRQISILLDLEILWRTIFVVLSRKGAY